MINKVKEFRSNMNLNQQQLGEIVGASRQTISSIERGDYSPSIVLALKIAHVFQVPVEEVFMIEEGEE
ncbi:MAG: helix-turn-helix transcriptional regulator [Erysipelotrichaceae bacterium]|nr:helix-turn-helix transcriptional regulator [Erysipelotrichaceae bacterium]